MRTITAMLLTAAFGWAAGLWLPYWSLSAVAMAVGFLVNPGGRRALLAGLASGGGLWGLLAWRMDSGNAGLLAARVGAIFGVDGGSMLLITALLGALLAGLALLVGDRARTTVRELGTH